MFLHDGVESLYVSACPQPYVLTRHPDLIALGRPSAWIEHTELVVLDLPAARPSAARLVCNVDHTIGPEMRYPMQAIHDIVANDPFAYFSLLEQLEALLGMCSPGADQRER
jgi:hypothetical protein